MNDLFSTLRDRVTVQDGLALLGESPRNKTFRCILPDHSDSSPSASIYRKGAGPEKWWCFVCAQGGDVIDLVAGAHGLPVRQAAEWLARARGIPVVGSWTPSRPSRRPLRPPRPYEGTQYEALEHRWGSELVALTFECRLPRCPLGWAGFYEYLESEIDRERAAWRERQARGLHLSDWYKVNRIRRWYAWALSLIEARGLPAGRPRPRRKKFTRALAF